MNYSPYADAVEFREFKVGGGTPPKTLAGFIAHAVNQKQSLTLSAIGHQAVGQAIKAVAIANGLLAPQGFQLAIAPAFEVKNIDVGDGEGPQERTSMRLQLIPVTLR